MDVVQTNESEELSKNEKKVFYIDYLISQIPGYLAYLYYINGVLTKLKEEGLLFLST